MDHVCVQSSVSAWCAHVSGRALRVRAQRVRAPLWGLQSDLGGAPTPGGGGVEREEASVPRPQEAALSRPGLAGSLTGRKSPVSHPRGLERSASDLQREQGYNSPKSPLRVVVRWERVLSTFLKSGGGFTGVCCLNS